MDFCVMRAHCVHFACTNFTLLMSTQCAHKAHANQNLRAICDICMHTVCTLRAHCVHALLCALCVYNSCNLYSVLIACTLRAHCVHIACTLCTLRAHFVHIACTLRVHCVHIACTLSARCVHFCVHIACTFIVSCGVRTPLQNSLSDNGHPPWILKIWQPPPISHPPPWIVKIP